jgi:ubiquinone/menaquinone biosynthesis C-methylase UbiE
MTHERGIDPTYLHEQYGTADRLQARIDVHARYSERQIDFYRTVLDKLDLAPGLTVLDIGCGNGGYHPKLAERGVSAVALDRSFGMVETCHRQAVELGLPVRLLQADAQALPFADASFDRAMANHMLYHVPNIPRAVAGLRRVLRPGGIFLATTGSPDDYAEMMALHWDGVRATGLPLDPQQDDGVMTRFSLENGRDYIAPYFPDVELRKREDALLLPTVEAFMRFYLSAWIYTGASGPDDPRVPPGGWHALAEWVAARAAAIIARAGVFRLRKTAGAFLARK